MPLFFHFEFVQLIVPYPEQIRQLFQQLKNREQLQRFRGIDLDVEVLEVKSAGGAVLAHALSRQGRRDLEIERDRLFLVRSGELVALVLPFPNVVLISYISTSLSMARTTSPFSLIVSVTTLGNRSPAYESSHPPYLTCASSTCPFNLSPEFP